MSMWNACIRDFIDLAIQKKIRLSEIEGSEGDTRQAQQKRSRTGKGQATSLQIKNVLWDKQSKFQHVQVFESVSNGVTIVLDGVIQLTEKDEPAYHEMFTHIGMFAHPKPERVLVVGGGDGGILREIAKHPSVKEMIICDIDEMVGEVSRKFMPSVGKGYDDSRVTVKVEDANKFLDEKDLQGKFDVILSDTSDPVGPAQFLFEAPFYKKMFNCLAPGGIVVTQAENIWLTLPLIERLIKGAGAFFSNVQYAVTQVPTYPSGIIGLFVCKKAGPGVFDCSQPMRKPPADMELKYYTHSMHTAAKCWDSTSSLRKKKWKQPRKRKLLPLNHLQRSKRKAPSSTCQNRQPSQNQKYWKRSRTSYLHVLHFSFRQLVFLESCIALWKLY
eukprot:g59509.t1